MYLVFQIGNQQYRASEGQVICIEKIDYNIGDCIEFHQILLIKNNDYLQLGSPFVKNKKIVATVIEHVVSKKIRIIKFRRRKHFRKLQGHRQRFTKVKIASVVDTIIV